MALPSWLSAKVTPLGRAPVLDSVGVGVPLAVTVEDPGEPTVKVALFPLVNVGAAPTTRANCCVAVPPWLIEAVMVRG